MRAPRPAVLFALIGCLSCASAPSAREDAPAPAALARPRAEGAPLVLTLAAAPTPAPWLEAPDRSLPELSLGAARLLAIGAEVNLYQASGMIFAAHRDDGVIGRLTAPDDAVWIGLGPQDTPWAATRDGRLWTSGALTRALRGEPWTQAHQIEGARAWDASPAGVVVAAGERVVALTAGETTWREEIVQREPALSLRQVFWRADGVKVALGLEGEAQHKRTYVSRGDGGAWQLASFQPEGLRRDGAWIWNGDASCVATLSADGVRWSARPDLSAMPGARDPRHAMIGLSTRAIAPRAGQLASASEPPAPPATEPLHAPTLPVVCHDPIPSAAQLDAAAASADPPARAPLGEPCQGARCALGARPEPAPPTRTRAALLADGQCDAAAPDRCHARHLARFEGASLVAIETPPPGCDPAQLHSARGLQVLVCHGAPSAPDASPVYTRDARASAWAPEGALAMRATQVEALSVAQDGTIVLHGRCDTTRCAPSALRAPVATGQAQAWETIAPEPGAAQLVRALTGGRALRLQISGPEQLALWLVEGKHQHLLTRLRAQGRALQEVAVIEGEVWLWWGEGFDARREHARW